MRTIPLALAVAGGLAVTLPAVAQDRSSAPRGSPAITEMRRQMGTNPPVPYVPQQNRVASAADALDGEAADARQYLMQARQAVQERRLGLANEMLERAETRRLTRSTLASEADMPMQSVWLQHVSAARAAVLRRDTADAMRQIDQALAGG